MKPPHRSCGVLLHVTSLPGPHGIGDLGTSSYEFVDWLVDAGQNVWQLLPITPIGPGNSPYQSVSAFAGSPLMVALGPLIEKQWLASPTLPDDGFDVTRVDFSRVIPWRLRALRDAAKGFFEHGNKVDKLRFQQWSSAHAGWLDDYSLFMAIESHHDGKTWWEWPDALRLRDPVALSLARTNYAREIDFWQFVQWCFDEQLAALKTYANERNVCIMGDLPIFVAHHSADCWARPDLYFLDEDDQPTVVAGVPPDEIGPEGQRWGNPLYRWDRMAAEDFAWWTSRVRRALDQADIFRIDHFRGFAGYYEIPASAPTAKVGQWMPGPGKKLFEAIERALGHVPIVAEDLGLITPDVIELRDAFGFPGMRVLQFAFGGDGTHQFLPHNYPTHTIVYTGTHDNDTARGWWDTAPEYVRAYAGCYLASGAHDIHWAMIRAACNSVAEMAIFPMQDVLGLDSRHRMNVPGTVEANWEWRFDWGMVGQEPKRVLGLIAAASGRGPFSLLKRTQGASL